MNDIETTLRLRIGRVHSNQNPHDSYELQMADERSGVAFLRVTLTPEQYASLVSCGTEVPEVPVKLRGIDHLGMRHENKTVALEFAAESTPRWGDPYIELVREAIKKYEVDGWQASALDLRSFNGHRCKQDNTNKIERYSVGMFRFVPWTD